MALLAAYNFDETSGSFLDSSINGRNWAPNNNAARTNAGNTLGGLTKSGVGMPVIANPAFGQSSARTFMFWSKGQGTAVWWLRWYNTAADTGTWGLYLLAGNLTLRLRKDGVNVNTQVPWVNDNQWHHYACTFDGSNARLYIDAQLVATSATVTAPLDSADLVDCMESGNNSQTMDDLRIYDEALGAVDIARLMVSPVVPLWRLVMPTIRERYALPGTNGSLLVSNWREITVFGDENGLFTMDQGAASGGADGYGAIPFGTKYIWLGGHVNTTDDPAVKDLWLAHGFEVENVQL